MINMGNKGNKNQTALWPSVIIVKFKLPVNITTIKMAELKTSS